MTTPKQQQSKPPAEGPYVASQNTKEAAKATAGATAERHNELRERVDPMPQFCMTGASAGGAYYFYRHAQNPKMAAVAAAVASAYAFGGYMIKNARTYEQLERGYSVSTLAGLSLAGLTAPRAYQAREVADVALSALGTLSGLANLSKWTDIKKKEQGQVQGQARGGGR